MPVKISRTESTIVNIVVNRICDKCGFEDKYYRGVAKDGDPWVCNGCSTAENIVKNREKYEKLIGAEVIKFSQDSYGCLDSILLKTKDGIEVLVDLGEGFISGGGFDE